jgi:hypothetical protein
MESERFWEIVLITLNDSPVVICRGFFVGQANLKREALISRRS